MLNLDTLKGFFDKSIKEPSFFMFVGFIAVVSFLYQDNQSKSAIIASKDKDCQEMIKKCQMDASEQMRKNREEYESELNLFIVSSNQERDSIYRFFYTKIRNIDRNVSSNMDKINDIKNEIRN